MKKKKHYPHFIRFVYQLTSPIVDPRKLLHAIPGYASFVKDLIAYARMDGRETINPKNIYPILHDKTETSPFDRHYFYQDIWAFRRIRESKAERHVDIGSRIDLVGFLTALTKVVFVDIRPLEAELENFESIKGDILALPFEDDSVDSLSCLHVAEHIGLGRYGDRLDPLGTKKACRELARVLARGGNLYFSLPVGKPELYFNAHRVHSPGQILDYFSDLALVEFSGINDAGMFKRHINPSDLENADYACGLFWFTKK